MRAAPTRPAALIDCARKGPAASQPASQPAGRSVATEEQLRRQVNLLNLHNGARAGPALLRLAAQCHRAAPAGHKSAAPASASQATQPAAELHFLRVAERERKFHRPSPTRERPACNWLAPQTEFTCARATCKLSRGGDSWRAGAMIRRRAAERAAGLEAALFFLLSLSFSLFRLRQRNFGPLARLRPRDSPASCLCECTQNAHKRREEKRREAKRIEGRGSAGGSK